MKYYKKYLNNDGYTLITVLLIMVIFMTLALSFMGQSLSTAKQTKVTENKIQLVDVAEMGTQYYTNFLYNEIEKLKKDIDQEVKSKLHSTEFNNLTKEEKEIHLTNLAKNTARNRLSKINTYPDVLRDITTNEDGKIGFIVRDIRFDGDVNAITFTSDATVDGVPKETISSILLINFNSLEVTITGGDSTGNSGTPNETKKGLLSGLIDTITGTIPLNKFIPDEIDSLFETCSDNQKDFTNDKCEYKGWKLENDDKKKDLIFNNSTFKITGDLELPNLNNTDLGGSTFYIEKNFINSNNLNKSSNYTLFIGGSASIGQMNNATNVTICANTLTNIGETNNTSDVKIYALVNKTNNQSVITDPNTFKNACTISEDDSDSPSNSGTTLQWGTPIIKEEYNYSN